MAATADANISYNDIDHKTNQYLVDIPQSLPDDGPGVLSPSYTENTDDEHPANAQMSPPPSIHVNHLNTSNRQRSLSDSNHSDHSNHSNHSRSRSNSISQSKIERLWRDQERHKRTKGYQSYSTLQKPPIFPQQQTLSTENDDEEDDEIEDEVFDRLLVAYARQESTSRDKRRSVSSSWKQSGNTAFSLYDRRKSPLRQIGKKLPTLDAKVQIKPGPVTKKGTRSRRADTTQAAVPSPSLSGSYFNTLKKCNQMNSTIELPTHIEKWPTNNTYESSTEAAITPSPEAHDDDDEQNKFVYPRMISPSPDQDVQQLPIEIIGGRLQMDVASVSSPNLQMDSSKDSENEVISPKRFKAKTPMVRSMPSADCIDEHIALNTTGSMTPNTFQRGRSSTIRPKGHHMGISRNLSVSDIGDLLNAADLDIKEDLFNEYSDSGDDDDEFKDAVIIMDKEHKLANIDPMQSELVFQSTTQSLMVSCGNTKEVFQELRKICIALKHDEELPVIISFDDKLLTYNHIEDFLQLLGFTKNKTKKQWICTIEDRVAIRLVDCAILQLHSTLQLIKKHASIKTLVHTHRANQNSNGANKDQLFKSPALKPLSIVQSQSVEDSYLCSDDEDDEKDDPDHVQLYELIWSITHNNNQDQAAKDVLLLCYPLVTTAKQILLCLEARFFNDDHNGRITVSNVSTASTASTASSTGSQYSPTSGPISSHASIPSFDGSSMSNNTHIRIKSSGTLKNYEQILSSFSVQAKVIEFIRHWMGRYWERDWQSNPNLVRYCKGFSERIKKAYSSDPENWDEMEMSRGLRLISMLDTTMMNHRKRRKMTLHKLLGDDHEKNKITLPNGGKHKKSKSRWSIGNIGGTSHRKLPKNVEDVNHVLIAEQITITQFELFKKIHPRECLKQSWKDKEQKHVLAPNITQYIDQFNRLTKWIQSSILVAENVKSRGRIIKRWLKVEQELYKLRNFQAIVCVYSALASNPIYILREAWSYVPRKHITQHEMIKVIMKATGNWKNLRRLQLETHPPMLPYFGMFAQDLIVIEETTNNRGKDGSINWDALWRVNAAIEKHLIYKNTAYSHLSSDATIQRWMNKELDMSGKLDDEWVYQVSRNVQLKDKRELGKDAKGKKTPSSPKKRRFGFGKSNN